LAYNHLCFMASVAQLIRASGCGSEGRGFNPHHSPQNNLVDDLHVLLSYPLLNNYNPER
jgi:hypothetical protein